MKADADSQCIAIIPARGGSKRLPRKNIRRFMGKPLIAHTIESCLESSIFNRVVVSTDSAEIADISEKYGAEIPFIRSDSLADDHTPISEVTADALERLDPEGGKFKYVAQLMANCPLRNSIDVVDSWNFYQENTSTIQVSIFEFGWQNPWWAMRINESGCLDPLFKNMFDDNVRSQDQPPLYSISGAIWWGSSQVIRRRKTFHVEDRVGWILPWYRAVDIDTEEDWLFAEALTRMEKNS